MQIVIDIPDKCYNFFKKEWGNTEINGHDSFATILFKSVSDGTPLPKGHGRLGDLSKIYVELNEAQIEGAEEYKGLGEAKQMICDAPTIIEADKPESSSEVRIRLESEIRTETFPKYNVVNQMCIEDVETVNTLY